MIQFTDRNAQQPRWSPRHFQVSFRPISLSIHLIFFFRSTMSAPSRLHISARWKYWTHFTAFHWLICSWDDVRLKRWARLFSHGNLKFSLKVLSSLCSKGNWDLQTWTSCTQTFSYLQTEWTQHQTTANNPAVMYVVSIVITAMKFLLFH